MNMNDELPPLSPETAELYLAPWLDGALSPEKSAAVQALVESDPALAELADAMRQVDGGLPNAFAATLAAPLPIGLARAAAAPLAETAAPVVPARESEAHAPAETAVVPFTRRQRFWPAMAACLLVLVLGGGPAAYIMGHNSGEQVAAAKTGWLAQVAAYHRVYAKEGRHLVEVGPEEAEHIKAWLSKRVGAEVTIPDFRSEGLTFAGARMLVAAGKPVAQLMYTQADGQPVGYCLIAQDKADTPTQTRRDQDLNMATWTADGVGHVVIGWDSPEKLKRLAARATGV